MLLKCPSRSRDVSVVYSSREAKGAKTLWRSTALSSAFVREKTFPDRFVWITGFAFGMPLAHSFQCRQRAIAADVECADCAGNFCQPWRRWFWLEIFACGLLGPIE